MKEDKIKDKIQFWQNYWPQLQSATDDSEDKLDSKIFNTSTGGIGLLLGTMGLGHEVLHKGWGFAVASLISFAFALSINIYYYRKQRKQHKKQFKEIKNFIENPQENDDFIHEMIWKDNDYTDKLSTAAYISIIIGMISFGAYITLNVIKL